MALKNKKNVFENSDFEQKLHKNMEFTAREQYKILRENIEFTIPADVKCPVIGVTSSNRGEGKSTTCVNLSYVMSETCKKVLLLDGDLRLPTVAKKMEMETKEGLTNFLLGSKVEIENYKPEGFNDNWYIMTSGPIPPNPSELLGSARMKNFLDEMREIFDYIIIDLPPVNLVSDAISVSKYVNGMITVIREGYTEKKELDKCFRQLRLSNVKILGCVVNEARKEVGNYRYKKGKYKYYKYSKYYEKTDEEKKDK